MASSLRVFAFRGANLATTAVAATTTRRAMSTAGISAAELDKHALALYADSPQSFYKLPIDTIDFKPSYNDFAKKTEPQLFVNGQPTNGLVHLTPPSATRFADFSETGTLGKSMTFNGAKVVISDLSKATLELTLDTRPLACQTDQNDVMLAYIEWLKALSQKYARHLMANAKSYPIFSKRFDESIFQGEIGEKLLSKTIRTNARVYVPPVTDSNADSKPVPVVSFKHRIYRPAKPGSNIIVRCKSDETMKKEGFSRFHIPLYNNANQEIALSESRISSGDVVLVQSKLRPALLDIAGTAFLSLKGDMRSVVTLRARERSLREAPFQVVESAQQS